MRKTSAGVLWFCASIFLAGAGWAEEGVETSESSGGAAAVAAPASVPAPGTTLPPGFEYTYPKRLAELNTADVAQLRNELEAAEAKLDEVDISAANAQVQAVRDQAQTDSAEVKALQAQITKLYEEISLAIDRDPAVIAAATAANQAHFELMDRLNFRSGLLKLIAEKERQGNWTEPEPAPEEKTP